MNKKVRIGIIGAGVIAPWHIESFVKFPDECEVVAICDISEAAVKKLAEKYGLSPYADHNQMIQDKKLDAVCICTPAGTHCSIALDALKHSCHIMCEKPMAVELSEARKMVDAAEKAKTVFAIGYTRRFEPPVIKMKKAIEAGEFGAISSVRMVFAGHAPGGHKEGRGGIILDNGSHCIDMLRFLLGDPIKVVAVQAQSFGTDPHEATNFSALLYGRNGEMFSVEAGWQGHAGNRGFIEVYGSKESATYDFLSNRFEWYKDKKWQTPEVSQEAKFDLQSKHFLDCIFNGTKCIAGVQDCAKTSEILDQMVSCAHYLTVPKA